MSFTSVFKSLQELFPQVDRRMLKAVAIEHTKDVDAAVEFILNEVLPNICISTEAHRITSIPNLDFLQDIALASVEQQKLLSQQVTVEEAKTDFSESTFVASEHSDHPYHAREALDDSSIFTVVEKAGSSSTCVGDYLDQLCMDNGELSSPSKHQKNVLIGTNQSLLAVATSMTHNDIIFSDSTNVPRSTIHDLSGSVALYSDLSVSSENIHCANPNEMAAELVQVDTSYIPEEARACADGALNSEVNSPTDNGKLVAKDSVETICEQMIYGTKLADLEEESFSTTVVTQSVQTCRIDVLGAAISEAKNNKASTFGSLENVHGTTNCFVIYNKGILIGIDSRANRTVDNINYIVDEEAQKYKLLVAGWSDMPAVGITAMGDSARIKMVWDYAEHLVNFNVRRIDLLAKSIGHFLTIPIMEGEVKNLSGFYLAGYSVVHNNFVVYSFQTGLDDGNDFRMELFEGQCFDSIGTGGQFAMNSFYEKVWPPIFTEEVAKTAVARAMLAATMMDPCSGGKLKMYQLRSPNFDGCLAPLVFDQHPVDLLLTSVYSDFNAACELFLFTNEHNSVINYASLDYCLRNNFMGSTRKPCCLGKVSENWSLFMVKYNEQVAEAMFLRGEFVPGFPIEFRRIRLLVDNIVCVFLIAKASLHTLKLARMHL